MTRLLFESGGRVSEVTGLTLGDWLGRGLLQDATGGGLVGVQALTKGLAGFGMGLLVGRFWVTNPLVQVPGLVLLSVAEGLGRFLLLQMFHYPAAFGELMLHVILPQALYNGLIGTLCILAEAGYELIRRRTWL